MSEPVSQRIAQLRAAIAAQEGLRPALGDAAVDAAVAVLREQLATLERDQGPPAGRLAKGEVAERKLVTILFADLTGFTHLAEQIDPETARQLMNACFDALKITLDRYGGHIDKYIGDEIMVLFGAPVAYEDHAERALRAALELQEALANFNRRLADDPQLAHLPPELRALSIHVGVNTGLVIAGGIGAHDYQQYSVVGDAVNIASRLTDVSAAGQVLVGEATYNLVIPLFDFAELPPISLKGKQEPQKVFQLLGRRAQPGRLRGLEPLGLRAPMVGRDAEFARLQEAVARLQAGQGGVISIVGEAGVGKSRLVAELRAWNPASVSKHSQGPPDHPSSLHWYEGRCLSYGEMLSYHPFLSLLRSLLGVSPEAEAAALQERLRAFLQDLLPTQGEKLYPYLADLLGIPLDFAAEERLRYLAGESRQWQSFQAVEQVLFHLAQSAPTIVVMEDLHWADPTSLALLERLFLLVGTVPLLFILVLRPYSGPYCERLLSTLQAAPPFPYDELRLVPLSQAQSQELVAGLLYIEALPGSVRDQMLSRAEGNPLFLEEIIRSLIGQGVLQRERDQWVVAPGVNIEQVAIPPTLQGVILARLDRLEAETKSVLQMAAVVGRIFWYRVLDYIASVDQHLESLLKQHLTRLEQVELIRETRRHPDLEYIFKHVLIQEAAYESLLKERRRAFHKRVAEAIETIFGEGLEEQYGLLARHYEAAGEVERAGHYLRLAGDRARRAYALAEATVYYQRALDLLAPGDDPNRHHLEMQLGLVGLMQGDFAQAGEHYGTAFRLQRQAPTAGRPAYARRPLRACWELPPRTLEPGIPCEIYSAQVIQQLFAGLIGFDTEMGVVPLLAERWEVDAEGRRYRFYLQPDARWSDGHPLTAHDFAFAWLRWMHPQSGSEIGYTYIVLSGAGRYLRGETDDPSTVGVRALGDHILEVELERPLAYFLPMLAQPAFYPLPAHRWPLARSPQEDPASFVGNGPFRLVAWGDDGLTLERNPFYAGTFTGNVGQVRLVFSMDADTRYALFRDDEVDAVSVRQGHEQLYAGVPPERWRRTPRFYTMYLGIMPSIPPVNDLRVRQALFLALDRTRLASLVDPVTTIAARGGFIPVGMPGHTPELMSPFDPDRARHLLREAGFADGAALPPLRFAHMSGRDSPLFPAVLAQWEQHLGLRVNAEEWTIAGLVECPNEELPPLFSMTWVADYPDPHSFVSDGLTQGRVWDDQTYWDQLGEAARTLDVRRRMMLYHELDRRLVVTDALVIPLSYRFSNIVVQPRVRSYPLLPVAHIPLKDVVIEDDG